MYAIDEPANHSSDETDGELKLVPLGIAPNGSKPNKYGQAVWPTYAAGPRQVPVLYPQGDVIFGKTKDKSGNDQLALTIGSSIALVGATIKNDPKKIFNLTIVDSTHLLLAFSSTSPPSGTYNVAVEVAYLDSLGKTQIQVFQFKTTTP